MVPRPEAKMIFLSGYSTRPAAAVLPARSAVTSVIPISPFHRLLVVEELHLHCVFVRLIADARIDPGVGTFDVEVVATRIPGQAGLLAVLIASVRAVHIFLLETDPRH